LFDVEMELEGWALFFAGLELTGRGAPELAALCGAMTARVRERADYADLPSHPAAARIRRLFRKAGTDPTRYRPSSEALLRRLLKGEGLPAIHPLVDLNNCLSAELAVPCCVMAEGTFEPPFRLRAGRAGEGYESPRGTFSLEGKPLLCDANGPLDTPITGNTRVKVTRDTSAAWFVAYLPAGVVAPEQACAALERLVDEAPVVRVVWTHAS
jgi:DNA/RNA-binding domain of Phe-tRNA-synthetase-like protein